MNVRVNKFTTYSVTVDGETFPTTHRPVEWDDPIVKIDGESAVVGYLALDHWDLGYYFDEFEDGEFRTFERDSVKRVDPPDADDLKRLVRANPGRVFWVNKYDHTLVKYYISGGPLENVNRHSKGGFTGPGGPDPMTMDYGGWDTSMGIGLFIVPEDVPEESRRAYADGTMETFTNWCNGNICGVVTETYRIDENGDWEIEEEDSVWGFIGSDHAKESLTEEFERTGIPKKPAAKTWWNSVREVAQKLRGA